MKKCILLISSFFLLLLAIPVNAASFHLSSDKKQISPGATFTIRVGGEAIGRVNLTASNGTLSTSSVWIEQNYVNVTVTAGASGNVVIMATPIVGFSDADANLYNPGAKSISIPISNSASSTPNANNSKPNQGTTLPKKSKNNDLASLKVKEGDLSPTFQSSKLEYSLYLSNEIQEINIEGTASDSKAKIEGMGKRKVQPGNNDIQIIVTAEDGTKKTYFIRVYVEELPEVFLNYQGKQIGVVKNLNEISQPVGFLKEQMFIHDKEVSVFTKSNLVFIYGQNEENEKNFYLFSKESQELISLCIPVQIKDQTYYVIETSSQKEGKVLDNILIDTIEIPCELFEVDNRYCLVSAVNEEGNQVEYLYEKTEGTIQLFPSFLNQCEIPKSKDSFLWLACGILLFLFSMATFFYFKEKKGGKHEKV